jgi:hypothetical protein
MNHISIAIEELKRLRPELYQTFFHRMYRDVDAFEDWRIPLAFGAVTSARLVDPVSGKLDNKLRSYRNYMDSIEFIRQWLKADLTMFFVKRDFFEAVTATEPPTQAILSGLRLPLPATLFILPKGAMSINDKPVANVGLAYWDHPKKNAILGEVFHKRLVVFSAFEDELFFAASLTMPELEKVLLSGWEEYLQNSTGYSKIEYDEEGLEMFNELFRVAVGLVLAMQAVPQEVHQIGKRRTQHKRDRNRFIYEPHIIGHRFKLERPAHQTNGEKGTHASPRMHWRSGHFRTIRFGAGRKESRVDWIKPVLVNKAVSNGPKIPAKG